jgi:HD superfamily phosphohydrolase
LDYNSKYWKHKSIRDPLYGFIHLSEREASLIATPFMHRLTRIKQLSHTYLVYPSATHTRFEHSLGVLYMADKLCKCFEIQGERREVIRCASLLHDVGHGPFSHLFENIMIKINGERLLMRMLQKL